MEEKGNSAKCRNAESVAESGENPITQAFVRQFRRLPPPAYATDGRLSVQHSGNASGRADMSNDDVIKLVIRVLQFFLT